MYDRVDPPALIERERLNLCERRIYQQISKDVDSQKSARNLIERFRMTSADNWEPLPPDAGERTFGVAVIWGPPGVGKSYAAKMIGQLNPDEAVAIPFKFLLHYMSPPTDPKDRVDSGGTVSPYERYKDFTLVMLKNKTALIICDEADLKGEDENGRVNREYLNRIKTVFEGAAKGVIELPGGVEGTSYPVDLRKTTFIFTCNERPDQNAFNRRMDIIEVRGMALPDRRRAAQNTINLWTSQLLPMFFKLKDEQVRAVYYDMAGLMEFIINESLDDPGPSEMQTVITTMFRRVAREYVDGDRTVPDDLPEGDFLKVDDDPEHGPHWRGANLDPEQRKKKINSNDKIEINATFKANRALDRVDTELRKAEAYIQKEELQGNDLPNAKYYFKQASEAKLKATETIAFVLEALRRQWAKTLHERSEDIQNSLGAIANFALNRKIFIFTRAGEDGFGSDAYLDCMMYCTIYDNVMRIPTKLKNLSHWEAGGNKDERERTDAAIEEIVNHIYGKVNNSDDNEAADVSDDRTRLGIFLKKYVDFTIPLEGKALEAAQHRAVPRSTLLLSGPESSGKKFMAQRLVEQLGLRWVSMPPEKYAELFDESVRVKTTAGNLTSDNILGDFSDLLKGNDIGCAIHIDISEWDPSDSKDSEFLSELDENLASTGFNPKITFPSVRAFGFDVPIRKVLKLVTTTTPIAKLGNLKNAEKIEIGAAAPETQRTVAEQAFKLQIEALDAYDFPWEKKKEIWRSAGSIMEYVLEAGKEQRLTLLDFQIVVSDLFTTLLDQTKKSLSAGNGTAPGSAKDEGTLSLTWEKSEAPPEKLPADLVLIVDRAIRIRKESQEPPQGSQGEEDQDSGKASADSSDDSLAVQLKELLAKIDDDVLTRTLKERLDELPIAPYEKETEMTRELCEAIEGGEEGKVREMLQNPDAKIFTYLNSNFDASLHVAVKAGRLPIVKIFLQDPRISIAASVKDKGGRNPLQLAIKEGKYEIFQALLQAKKGGKKSFPLFDPDATDTAGNTAAHLAVDSGDEKIFGDLLERGVNVNQPGARGQTILHRIVEKNNLEFLKILQEKRWDDVDEEAVDHAGLTARVLAAQLKRNKMVPLLLPESDSEED